MANCHNCWWADFNPDSPTLHTIHEEPDYLQMKGPFSEAPMIRIVQSCGKGQSFFKTYGMRDHDCPKFETPDEYQAALDSDIAAKRAEWKHPTNRKKMDAGANGFAAIAALQEGDDDAYKFLVDLMFIDLQVFTEIVIGLDDMNMRGAQIMRAVDYADNHMAKLLEAVRNRDPAMVAYVNENYPKSNEEEAVERGASLYGHKDNPNGVSKRANGTGTKRIRGRKLIPRGREVKTSWGRGAGTGADDVS